MKINAINSYKKASNPSFREIHPAYIAKMSERLGYVQRDVVDLKRKADEAKKREELIIKQNQNILHSLALLGNMVAHQEDYTTNEKYSRANRIIELSREYL